MRHARKELFPAFTTPQHTMLEATALTPAEWDAMVAAETMTGPTTSPSTPCRTICCGRR